MYKELILISVPIDSNGFFINNVGCLRYSYNNDKNSSCIEPFDMKVYLDKTQHVILGYSFFNNNKVVIIGYL